jgi:fructose-1,6-bisphosphatase I
VRVECNPIAMIVEQAGGMAVRMGGGQRVQRVRELQPTDIHQRCPIACGSSEAVKELIRCYEEAEGRTKAKL